MINITLQLSICTLSKWFECYLRVILRTKDRKGLRLLQTVHKTHTIQGQHRELKIIISAGNEISLQAYNNYISFAVLKEQDRNFKNINMHFFLILKNIYPSLVVTLRFYPNKNTNVHIFLLCVLLYSVQFISIVLSQHHFKHTVHEDKSKLQCIHVNWVSGSKI